MDRSPVLLGVTADEPGERLVLEGQQVSLAGVVGGVVAGVLEGLRSASGAADSESLWRTWRLRADRADAVLVVDEAQAIRGEQRTESIALADVDRLVVRTVFLSPSPYSSTAPPFSAGNPRHVEAIVHFREGDSRPPRAIGLDVLGIDTLEKAADLAFRLGAAMGLRSQRVVRSDPRRIEVELHAAAGAEALPVPRTSVDYPGGRVAPAAVDAAARQRISRFDPASFPSDFRATRWSPGEEVRFDRPLQGSAYGCLPVALAGLLLGPGVWLMFRDVAHTVVPMLIGATLVGLAVAAVAFVFVAGSLPRQTRISWPDGTLTVGGALRRRRLPLARVAALELQCVRRITGHESTRSPTNEYYCRLSARLRDEAVTTAATCELVTTSAFRRAPEPPYDASLPLARELAEALGVPWTLTDYK
jgi:hypothetical protein